MLATRDFISRVAAFPQIRFTPFKFRPQRHEIVRSALKVRTRKR